ncbi:MAG: pantoate--beta-alanine ligase [Flavobacteriaceae bacterium CG_4_8_14_3_um_filter_34_10]|nr:pantoate--beta-alanine ligase [Flavobacteriia bacterium]OIP51340.1 MAG: pantoate--beta-alanine ligase [Flavobacteriaceae bacterium CG2_30_34_30]PIQ17843.1 MAG: pantoate--beta-alanine ligase [Flavobacteriaceae bacterium CG18_big_fil_WC_8_21_14_2_50_34_36]PIV51246.1 MAG: pantoate--beta-alanine ligase [Flavobacteriaceae bacterium CG02_land_8_20_14_3_00_34_13]PIX08370.1 MAG: pantoate--beta-alanine ligase [Flavobacteriaceae bacterium CG_4_8_14_3_um_filter_34_10]PIZ07508.1 MAG: pantoate--beta-ala
MQVFNNIQDLKPILSQKKEQGHTLGFVPTMGALHQGHLSLIQQAHKENDDVIVTIFVNPTQFDNSLDFEKYPRIVEADLILLSNFEKKILVYLPQLKDIYPNGITSKHFDFGGIENEMEGKFRTGHFDGVGTVLKSFFDLLQPTNAYFGEKDFQQLQIVKKLAALEKLPVNIIGCPIFREPSGLAMSSRNKRLRDEQLQEAAILFKLLSTVKNDFGTKNAKELTQWVEKELKKSKIVTLEYFEIADENTLKPIVNIEKNKKYRAFIAVFVGEVRLIDNIALN